MVLPQRLSTIKHFRASDAVNSGNPKRFHLVMRHMNWTINGRTFRMEAVANDENVRMNTLEYCRKEVGTVKYYFSKTLHVSFDDAVSSVTEGLKQEGFGILTEIDVKKTLKKKLDVDFKNYRILGACNPPYAYRALQTEDKIGTMLPCNVIVQEAEGGDVEVAAVDPIASMQAIENSALREVAEEIRFKLKRVIDNL